MISLEKARALKAALGYVYGSERDTEFPLDQLLAEIEKRGYQWKLYKNIMRFKTGYYDIAIYEGSCESVYHTPFATKTPEDAAADALLWLMGQAGK